MFNFKVRERARQDIQQIVDYYDEKAPYTTDRFLEILYAKFDTIKKTFSYFFV